ncbi:MAG: hemerythrin domain-containing protein [Planctomycetes bacterium]|nr:hemerythrin domain-containing protein [Planctomycetota bacterium]
MPGTCTLHGTKKSPTQVLKDEHRVIETVLDALERHIRAGRVDKEFLEKSLDFFRNFADGCHHAKEEDELFPVLESAGIPRDNGPIGCMLFEHERGRALLRTVAENLGAAATDALAAKTVRWAAGEYIALLRQHIQKEDNVLFVMADQALGPQEQALMSDAFDRTEQANGNAGKHEHYLALAQELVRKSNGGG